MQAPFISMSLAGPLALPTRVLSAPEPLPSPSSTRSLVEGLRAGEGWAQALVYDRHAPDVVRVLRAVLGPDQEAGDLLQETFLEVFRGARSLRDPDALGAWVKKIAVHTARSRIRRRQRSRWLLVLGLADAPDPPAPVATPEVRQAVAEVYRILGDLPGDLRVPFALRFIEGFELTEVAAACDLSLATVKRRLAAGEDAFRKRAVRGGRLDEWLVTDGRLA